MASPDATNISVKIMTTTPKKRPSTPDLAALIPVKGRNNSKETVRARPVWTVYSTVHAKFMAPQEHQPIIPTENAGSSDKPAGQMPKTRSSDHRIQEDRRKSLPS